MFFVTYWQRDIQSTIGFYDRIRESDYAHVTKNIYINIYTFQLLRSLIIDIFSSSPCLNDLLGLLDKVESFTHGKFQLNQASEK